MSDKQTALEAIGRLPDGVSLRDIANEMEYLAAIREGEVQAAEGKVISLEQVERNLQSWLSKSS